MNTQEVLANTAFWQYDRRGVGEGLDPPAKIAAAILDFLKGNYMQTAFGRYDFVNKIIGRVKTLPYSVAFERNFYD